MSDEIHYTKNSRESKLQYRLKYIFEVPMNNKKKESYDIIDEDLYEEFDDEELLELVEEARKDALKKAQARRDKKTRRTPFPKWIFWIIALAMVINVAALLPQTFSIPAIDFLKTSAQLSMKEDIKLYKKSVVVIETETGKGTGFSFNEQGDILTNYHVVEGYDQVTVGFSEQGLFVGDVVEEYPDIDVAVLKINEQNMPHLQLADEFQGEHNESIYFIGNPLQFSRIANEGTMIDWAYVQSKDFPVMMIDAPVYRGNSGSPVINEEGLVIGIIFATLDHDIEGKVGLFIPIDRFYDVSDKKKGNEHD